MLITPISFLHTTSGNTSHPSSGGKLCKWTVFVLRVELFLCRVVKSRIGEVVTSVAKTVDFYKRKMLSNTWL